MYVRIAVVLLAVAGLAGCGTTGLDDGTTVERFVPGSNEVQRFEPGSPELEQYMSSPSQSVAPSNVSQQFVDEIEVDGDGRSCSSRDGKEDCFCTGGCCRTETSCRCC
jgi:hypothetical protein